MDYKVKEFCKLISEFALEYKTVRDRLLQQQEKRANHRERHKTRGKMITDVILILICPVSVLIKYLNFFS